MTFESKWIATGSLKLVWDKFNVSSKGSSWNEEHKEDMKPKLSFMLDKFNDQSWRWGSKGTSWF